MSQQMEINKIKSGKSTLGDKTYSSSGHEKRENSENSHNNNKFIDRHIALKASEHPGEMIMVWSFYLCYRKTTF